MRIAVVGTGYVGLVSGTCFAEFGNSVICVDKNAQKITDLKAGKIPIYEPGLTALVQKQIEADRLSFTTDLKEAMEGTDAIFIAVGTPPRPDNGHADLKYVHQVAREIADNLTEYSVIVTKSTVPVGTAQAITNIIKQAAPHAEFDVCSNPEFLREGSAINDFMKPDRIVIGTRSQRAEKILKTLYRPLTTNEVPLVITSPETSETIRLGICHDVRTVSRCGI